MLIDVKLQCLPETRVHLCCLQIKAISPNIHKWNSKFSYETACYMQSVKYDAEVPTQA